MGAFLGAIFGRKGPETPIKGCFPRIKNIALRHFRGILGVLLPVALLSWQINMDSRAETAVNIWIWMACFFLFQPVSIQVTGSIPIFAFPMMGVLKTVDVVKCYLNEGIVLFIIGGMLQLLLNNSGFDRRLALFFLCKGSPTKFSPTMLLLKCSFAGFFSSIFCNRLIVASTLIQYMTPVLMDLQAATARYRATEPEFNKMRYIINNAIQISCSFGGIAIVHASFCTLAARAILTACVPRDKENLEQTKEYPDVLNYAQYTGFAFPVAIVLFIVTFIYHAILLKIVGGKKMTMSRMTEIRNTLLKYKTQIPSKVTTHEKLTILFEFLALVVFFGRYIDSMTSGWAQFSIGKGEKLPKLKDATVAAIFVVLLHVLPRSFGFLKVCIAKKKSQLPPTKAESAILFWRFVDKNTNYGYFFVIGAGVALWHAANLVDSAKPDDKLAAATIVDKLGFLAQDDFCISLLIICILSMVLSNIISGVASVAIFLPAVLCLSHGKEAGSDWINKIHQPALAVGIASSFGFISPFLYTPAYFCHHTGKVPKMVMLKYTLVPCLLSAVLLYLMLCFFSPSMIGTEYIAVASPTTELPYGATTTTTTTGAPEAPGGELRV